MSSVNLEQHKGKDQLAAGIESLRDVVFKAAEDPKTFARILKEMSPINTAMSHLPALALKTGFDFAGFAKEGGAMAGQAIEEEMKKWS